MVVLQQPTKPLPTLDLAGTLTDLVARFDELNVEALVISFSMIMREESGDRRREPFEM